MPIPYLGSKRKSASKIYQTITNLNPQNRVLVDLFCGGLAITEEFVKNGWQVFANDKNKYVVALAKQIIQGFDEPRCLKFVNRERFFDVLASPNKYEDWYVGYVMCVWSFGNNQSDYMFGRNIEKYKQAGYELVVNDNPTLLQQIQPELVKQFYLDLKSKNDSQDWRVRRLVFRNSARKVLGCVEQLQSLQSLKSLESLESLQSLENLKRLERLEYQTSLFSTTPITFTSLDYREVEIPDKAIIYCDPPYKGRAEYKEGGFDHDKFWDWVRQKSKTHKVYVSEYQAPDDFKKVLEFKQGSNLAGGTNKNQPNECVFIYAF